MLGASGVAALLSDYLNETLPGVIIRLDAELGPVLPPEVGMADGPGVADDFDLDTAGGMTVDGTDLPPPLSVQPIVIAAAMIDVESVGIDDWPFLVIVVQSMRRMRFLEFTDAGARVFECTYPTAVFSYARGDGFHSTDAIRARLVLAVRETLLVSVNGGGTEFVIDESTLVERYSDIGSDEVLHATVAAGRTDLDVRVTEVLTPLSPAVGVVATVQPDTRPLPPHPALD